MKELKGFGKIEYGVRLPKKQIPKRGSPILDLASAMKRGASVLIKSRNSAVYLVAILRTQKKKPAMRQEGGHFRVWSR